MRSHISLKGCHRAYLPLEIAVSTIKRLLGYFTKQIHIHIYYCEWWTLSSLPVPKAAGAEV